MTSASYRCVIQKSEIFLKEERMRFVWLSGLDERVVEPVEDERVGEEDVEDDPEGDEQLEVGEEERQHRLHYLNKTQQLYLPTAPWNWNNIEYDAFS